MLFTICSIHTQSQRHISKIDFDKNINRTEKKENVGVIILSCRTLMITAIDAGGGECLDNTTSYVIDNE